MSTSVLAVASCLVSLLGFATSVAAQRDELLRRLRSFAEDLEAAAKTELGEPSDADLDLLEQAGIDRDRFGGIGEILAMLRFGATLRDEDFAGAIEFGVSKEGRDIAFPLQTLCVLRGRMDGAARLTITALLELPRDQRSYSTWKRWEYFFGSRDDFPRLSYDFTLALLRCFEQGDEKEQQVVQDLIKPNLTREQIPDLRKAAEARCRQMETELAGAGSLIPREKLWVEDHKGLREVPAKSVRRVDRFEIRLQAGSGEPWGTLLLYDEFDPEVVTAKLTALRHLAASAQDDGVDFGEGRGPIAIVLRNAEPWPSRSRIEDLDKRITLALATAEVLRVRMTLELPPDAARDERAVSRAKALLGAVRGGARRLRELTNTVAQQAEPDPAADERVLRTLHDATGEVEAWLVELMASVPAPAADAGWRDMEMAVTKSDRKGRGRTRVLIDADTVRVIFVETSQRASDVRATTDGVRTLTLRREDLRDARLDARADGALELTTTRPVLVTWADPYLSTSCLRARFMPGVWIACDTAAHRDELIAALRRFASSEGR